jgi:hypothetical protein
VTSIAVGARVRLRYAPVGDWGIVTSIERGKVRVTWNDLELTTKHSLEALLPEPACTRKGTPAQ